MHFPEDNLDDNIKIFPAEEEEEEQQPEPVEENNNNEQDDQPAHPEKAKRNSGHSGPTTPAGRERSSMNALKHGACSQTLILQCESVEAWKILLSRWCRTYHVSEEDNSLEYDFVRKAAQAEWFRIRCQRNYDLCAHDLGCRMPSHWSPEEVKKHDLLLRYKTAAERAFSRENRAVQQHFKFIRQERQEQLKLQLLEKQLQEQKQPKPSAKASEPSPEKEEPPTLQLVGVDKNSPTGWTIFREIRADGVEIINPRPFEIPNPLPEDWVEFHLPPDKDAGNGNTKS